MIDYTESLESILIQINRDYKTSLYAFIPYENESFAQAFKKFRRIEKEQCYLRVDKRWVVYRAKGQEFMENAGDEEFPSILIEIIGYKLDKLVLLQRTSFSDKFITKPALLAVKSIPGLTMTKYHQRRLDVQHED